MMWKDFNEQQRVTRILQGSLEHDRIAHAYLFAGPRGAGKKAVALQLAKSLLCRELASDSCEACADCKRINGGNHPDVHLIEPDGASIKIEQVRNLQKEFSYRAVEGNRKIYIVDHADTMTVQAANSLLKFLEEPASGVTAILLTERVHAVLPTILSRCQLLTFQPLPPDKLAQRLIEEGYASPVARIASQLTAGLEEARKLCQSESFAQLRNQVVQLSEDILNRGSYALLTIQDKITGQDNSRDELMLVLDIYLIWLRDILLWQSDRRDLIVHDDQQDVLAKQALRVGRNTLLQHMELVLETRRRLEQNASPQLSLERMVLELQEG
ncbi:MAG: DNA polymerase III subunit delta' [Bacillaceae bacterium]|nr:DNA polymerase III subunit delta' [Bacillaceae bacterium]